MKNSPLYFIEFVVLFALITAITALSIDAMLPAFPAIADNFAITDYRQTQQVISIFILGTVFGELAYGIVADAFGRRTAIISGLAIYAFGTLLAIYSWSLTSLLIARLIQGVAVSGTKIGSRAMIRDLYVGDEMAKIMSLIMTIFILIPMLAPALGQWIMLAFDWRAIFWGFLLLAIVIAVWFYPRQPETLKKSERVPLSFHIFWTNTKSILTHTKVMAYTTVSGLIFGGMIMYLSTSQAMFEDFYGVGQDFPLYFAILAFGIGISALLNSRFVMRYGAFNLTRYAMMLLCASSISMLVIGYLHDGVPPFFAFMGCLFVMLFCVGVTFGNINALAMKYVGKVAGLGASVIGSLSSTIAVIVGIGVGRFYNQTVTPIATMFAIIGLVCFFLMNRAKNSDAKAIVY